MSRRKKILLSGLLIMFVFVVFGVVTFVQLTNAVGILSSILFDKEVTKEKIYRADNAVETIKFSTQLIRAGTQTLSQIVPVEYLRYINWRVAQIASLSDHLKILLGRSSEQHYVVFFLNNREIRPGGGFIGSVGFISIKNYSITKLRVEDVYEIDGQIITHYPPHPAVAKYLQVPHLFLRDSNFSPDFESNVQVADKILRASGYKDHLDGAIGITTSAVESIIGAFGPVYIPDYGQTITKDNFYIVTQTQVETHFFPGSIQKRSFLSAVLNGLMLKAETADKKKVGWTIFNNLNNKNIVLFSALSSMQTLINDLGWSGRMKAPINRDYLYPVEANVGANKANYFVRRDMQYRVSHAASQDSSHTFTSLWKNDSPENDFLAGTYKNYFQLFLPNNISITKVTLDNNQVTDFALTKSRDYSQFSHFIEIEPKKQRTLVIEYTSPAPRAGDTPKTLFIQKQTGSQDSDISVNGKTYSLSHDLEIFTK